MEMQERPNWAQGLSDNEYCLALRGSFTLNAAAPYGDVAKSTLRAALDRGDLRGRKVGKGWRIAKRDLDAYLGLDGA